MEEYKVEWKLPRLFKNADPEKVHNEILSLSEVTPQALVQMGEKRGTELYKCFEHDDKIAAYKYRFEQAKLILRTLVVIPKREEVQPVRVFQISSKKNVYQDNQYFLQNEDEYQILLKRALSELKSFQNRYHMLSELEAVFDEIAKL